MIPARIVETQDEKSKAFVESVEATFDKFEVSFYCAGNTESQALVTALSAVKSYSVNHGKLKGEPAAKAEPAPEPQHELTPPKRTRDYSGFTKSDDHEHSKEP